MKIEGNTIIFKSFLWNYELEKSGKKPCTVRVIPNDERDDYMEFTIEYEHRGGNSRDKRIRIVKVDDSTEFFERDITHIEQIGSVLYSELTLICWRHEDDGGDVEN